MKQNIILYIRFLIKVMYKNTGYMIKFDSMIKFLTKKAAGNYKNLQELFTLY